MLHNNCLHFTISLICLLIVAEATKNVHSKARVVGDIDYFSLEKVFDYILKSKDTLLVVSSDLSHFYSQQDAMKLDLICLNAITNKDLKAFENCEACGKVGLEAIIECSIKNNLQTKLLHYCTSADISNDKTRVVGYTSAIIGE